MGGKTAPEPVQPVEAHDYDTDASDELVPDYDAELVDGDEKGEQA